MIEVEFWIMMLLFWLQMMLAPSLLTEALFKLFEFWLSYLFDCLEKSYCSDGFIVVIYTDCMLAHFLP